MTSRKAGPLGILGRVIFISTAMNQRFVTPHPNQAQIRKASSKRVLPFDNATEFVWFLMVMNLHKIEMGTERIGGQL